MDERSAASHERELSPLSGPDPEQAQSGWVDELRTLVPFVLALLALQIFVGKHFYIPSESMMPNLLVGDQLVVTKYPYGWSYTAPIFHLMPETSGRVMGELPQRGDVITLEPSGRREDWIKRVIGLPGDTIEVRGGTVILNGTPVKQEPQPNLQIPVDANARCDDRHFPDRKLRTANGKLVCDLPIVKETLPNGVSYNTIDLGYSAVDDFPPTLVPDNHVFVMGDNRDGSADSRVSKDYGGLGGPIPWENISGRAEFITVSMDGNTKWYNPISWFTSMREGRSGTSLRAQPMGTK